VGKTIQKLSAVALGLLLSGGGCAGLADRGPDGGHPGLTQAAGVKQASEPGRGPMTAPPNSPRPWSQASTSGAVTPALALEGSDDGGMVRQTAGVLGDSASAMKKGVDKVAESLKPPSPPVVPAEDPTSVFSKSRPSPELYVTMANFHEQAGRLAQAEQAYQQALKLSPKHLGAHLNYARFKDRQGQSQAALELYQKAAKLYPKEPIVLNDLGLFYARKGKNKEAVQAYERAIQLQPKRALYRNNIAMVLVEMGQPEKALVHLRAVSAEPEVCYKMGYLLQKKGQLSESAKYFARAVQLNPSMEEAKGWLQQVRAKMDSGSQTARRALPAGQPPQADRVLPLRIEVPRPSEGPQLERPNVTPRRQPLGQAEPAAGAGRTPLREETRPVRPTPASPQRLPAPDPREEGTNPGDAMPEDAPLPPTSGVRTETRPVSFRPSRLPPAELAPRGPERQAAAPAQQTGETEVTDSQ